MGNQLPVLRQEDGSYAAVQPDGSRIPISPSKMKNVVLPMSAVSNTAGLAANERMAFMNLPNTPEIGRQYLESIGYETRKLPKTMGEWNFAVRKSPDAPWEVVDPSGLEIGDFGDFLGNLLIGATSTVGGALGSAAGPAGTVLGAGVGGGIGEAARQGIAELTGVGDLQQFDPDRVMNETVLSGVAVPAGAAVSGGLKLLGRGAVTGARGVGKLGATFGARMAGIRNAGRLSATDVGWKRAAMKGFGEIAGDDERAETFMKIISDIDDAMWTGKTAGGPHSFPEKIAEMRMLSEASQKFGVTTNLRLAFERLLAHTGREILPGMERKAAVKSVMNALPGMLDGTTKVPATMRPKIKQLQKFLDELTVEINEAEFRDMITRGVSKEQIAKRAAELGKSEREMLLFALSLELEDPAWRSNFPTLKPALKNVLEVLEPLVKSRELDRTIALKNVPKSMRADLTNYPELPDMIREWVDSLQENILGGYPISKVPVDIADAVRETAMKAAFAHGALGKAQGRGVNRLFGELLEDVGMGTQRSLHRSMAGHLDPADSTVEFLANHAQLQRRTRSLNSIKKYIGWGDDPAKVMKRTQTLLRGLSADTHMGFKAYLDDIEKLFGLPENTFNTLIEESAVTKAFGFRGAAEAIGPLTAQGGLRGPAMFGLGAGLGFISGGSASAALLGGAAGAALGSPMVIHAGFKAGLKADVALKATEAAFGNIARAPSTQLAKMLGYQTAARSVIAGATTTEEKPRRKVRIGSQF